MTEIFNSTELRRELHPLAELGLNTKNTAQYVLDHLEKIGVEAHRVGNTNGVLGVIDSGVPGPTVMLRADMDALPFEVDGKKTAIHACGHDGHTAMLLEAASRLVGNNKKGKLKLLFQPAEETLEGANVMIKEGVLDGVDYLVGAHVRPIQDLEVGTLCPAVNHTASCPCDIYIHGKSAHASRPHLGINSIYVGTAIVNAISQIQLPPNMAWSVKPTQFDANDGALNIIPASAHLGIDMRAQTTELMKQLIEEVRRAAESSAAAFGATVEVKFATLCPAANYDPEITDELAECIREVAGDDKLAPACGGGGEDFHFYKIARPEMKNGYFGVGVGVTPGLHKQNMTFDDKLLPLGAAVFVKFALRHLG